MASSGSAPPVALVVLLEIDEKRVDEFVELMKTDAAESRKEEGCLRFDVLKDDSAPNKFILYEAYRDDAAFESHQATPHFALWQKFYDSGGATNVMLNKCTASTFQV